MTTWSWILRYGHVLGGAAWVGGYALLALVIVPILARERSATLGQLAITAVRVLTYAGTLTIALGLLLIERTRGYAQLLSGEWGALVLGSLVVAVALIGIGGGGRPRTRAPLGGHRARAHDSGDRPDDADLLRGQLTWARSSSAGIDSRKSRSS